MNAPTARPAPIGAYLAIGAGALALIALAMPWFTIDMAEFQRLVESMLGQMAPELASQPEAQALVGSGAEQAATELQAELYGYRDGVAWVAFRVLTVIGVVVASMKILSGEVTGLSQRGTFTGIAIAFAIRPVLYLTSPPGASEFESLGTRFEDLLHPAPGLYMALFAAVLMAGAAALAHVGDSVAIPSDVEHSVPPMPGRPAHAAAAGSPAFVPQSAHVPQAYVPPGPPAHVPQAHVPQAHVPQAHVPQAHVPQAYVPPGPPAYGGHVTAQARSSPATAAYTPMPGGGPAPGPTPQTPASPRSGGSVAPPGMR